MRKNLSVALALIACESQAVKLRSQGLFDSITKGVQAVTAISGNQDAMNVA